MTEPADQPVLPADEPVSMTDATAPETQMPEDADARSALLDALVPEVEQSEQLPLQGEPAAEPDSAAEPGAVPVQESAVAPQPEAEAAAAPEPEPEPEPKPEPKPEPEPAVGLDAARMDLPAAPLTGSAPWWPFIIYGALWVVLSVAAGYMLVTQVPQGTPVYDSQVYTLTILGGIVLTIAGPVLILAVWLAEWFRRGDEMRRGLFLSALLKGSLATLFGVVVWWVTLIAVDAIRLGRPL